MQNTNKHWTKTTYRLKLSSGECCKFVAQCSLFLLNVLTPGVHHPPDVIARALPRLQRPWCVTDGYAGHVVTDAIRWARVCAHCAFAVSAKAQHTHTHTHTHAHNVTCQLRAEGRYPQTMCWDMKLQSCTTRVNLRQKINKRSTRTFWH